MALLEGLEVKVKLLSETLKNKDFRTDSDFWTKELKKNPKLIYSPIGALLEKAQYGISIAMNEEGEGFPIYRMNEIHNMFCDFEVSKHADISKEELKIFKLNDKDVLFNRTNSYEWVGRTGIYRKTDERDFVFASYLVRFIPNKDKLTPEYLTAFLNSKYGVWDVKRRSRQSINQTNVNPEEVKEIDIPLLSMGFQNKITKRFDDVYEFGLLSKATYTKAESLLLQSLNLQNFKTSQSPVNIKSFKESFGTSGRMDAEYYQLKYEQVISKIEATNYERLADIVRIKKSIEPGSANYTDEGLPFVRVSDYNKFGLSTPDKYLTDEFCKEKAELIKKLKPKKETILFTKDGTVGAAYMLREDADFITSGAILHLTIKDKSRIIPEYLTLVLNSRLVQKQAERDAGGSVILHWRVGEIENVIVPIIDIDKQKLIASLVEESFQLKAQSEHLLEVAKRAVEIAIEEDEEAAMSYISNET